MLEPLDILAVLAADTNWIDLWEAGRWLEASIGPYIALLGRATLMLLVGAPFTLALWIQTEDFGPPAVILTLFMGLLISGAPPGATIAGYVIVLIATTLAYRSITGVSGR